MIKIVADSKIPFFRGVLEPYARVIYLPGYKITARDLRDADGLIIRTRTRCNARLLEGSPVKFIASATIGFDHIDTDYCREKGIAWANAPGCNAGSVLQYFSSALAHIFNERGRPFKDLSLGIIGAGHVGRRLVNLASQLGIRTLVNDPPRARAEGPVGFSGLQELLEQADIVSLHVPLNYKGPDKTFHLAGKTFFKQMKPGAWLINTSRGEVIEKEALLEVLESEKLGGSILDVWEQEPFIDRKLLNLVSIATPHIAGYSVDGKANGTSMSIRALSRFFGLNLNDWQASRLPLAPNPLLKLPINEKNREKVFSSLSLQAYNIHRDDHALRQDPSAFEILRNSYPVRREPHALKVMTTGTDGKTLEFILSLGYGFTTK